MISTEITKLERDLNIRVLFASESGARSWGLGSPSSDYDVRFIFHHPVEEYLKVKRPRDVIDIKVPEKNIDFMGYDIYKFLELISKSNVNMLEMLNSSKVYKNVDNDLMKEIFKSAVDCFSPKIAFYHYHALGYNNFNKYILKSKGKGRPLAKAYVYALRGLLGAWYVLEYELLLPVDFEKFVRNSNRIPKEIKDIYLKRFIPIKKGLLYEVCEREPIVDEFLDIAFKAEKERHAEVKSIRNVGKRLDSRVDDVISEMLLGEFCDGKR